MNKTTRKKFLLWGGGLLSAFTFFKIMTKEKKKKETVKMLAEDGRLVEVDMDLAKRTGKKVSNEEVHNWIKTKPTNQ